MHISKEVIKFKETELYDLIKDNEKHHDHEICFLDNAYYWVEDKEILNLVGDNLNKIIYEFEKNGIHKNTDERHKFYRDIGYSISGYWELVYWEVNNPNVDEYVPNKNINYDKVIEILNRVKNEISKKNKRKF